MDNPQPKETKGVPWADHNETESSPPDTRREEYADADPDQTADERAATSDKDLDQADGSRDASSQSHPPEKSQEDQKPIYDL